jgi:hypothetical protein
MGLVGGMGGMRIRWRRSRRRSEYLLLYMLPIDAMLLSTYIQAVKPREVHQLVVPQTRVELLVQWAE